MPQFPQVSSYASSTAEVLGNVPVGIDGFGEERLVPISVGLWCDPLVRIVCRTQVGYRVAAATW